MNNQEYVESLERFLEASNEDWTDVEAIHDALRTHRPEAVTQPARRPFRVLDIGAGNGKKTANLLSLLTPRQVELDSIEPTPEQYRLLKKTRQEQGARGACIPQTFQEAALHQKYDLILALHSLYQFPRNDDGTLAGLERIAKLLSPRGVGVIIHEDLQSGLQTMKDELRSTFGHPESTRTDYITRTLDKHSIPYTVDGVAKARIPLTELLAESDCSVGRSFSFLFSDRLGHNPLTEQHHKEIGAYVRSHYGAHGYIPTQNRIILVDPN